MYSYGPPHMAVQKQDDQLELTYSNYVRTQDVTPKTCRKRWVIGRSGERGLGISVLAARHDDDDEVLLDLSWVIIWGCKSDTTCASPIQLYKKLAFFVYAGIMLWHLFFKFGLINSNHIYPTPPLGQDMT